MSVFRNLRKEKGLTQIELAQMLDIDQTTVSKWELGKAIPDVSMLCKLSDFFDVSIDYLLEKSAYFYPDRIKNSTRANDNYTIEERQLVANFRELNQSGKRLVNETIKTLLATSTGGGQNKIS